jgi:ribosomal protein S21
LVQFSLSIGYFVVINKIPTTAGASLAVYILKNKVGYSRNHILHEKKQKELYEGARNSRGRQQASTRMNETRSVGQRRY